MGKIQVNEKLVKKSDFDLEARWRGELDAQERQEIKAWAKKAGEWCSCSLRVGKERSRLVVKFDKQSTEKRSREHIGVIESMLNSQNQGGSNPEAVKALADLRQAPSDSAQGLLVKDYGKVLVQGWAIQASEALQALVPARCGLKLSLAKNWE